MNNRIKILFDRIQDKNIKGYEIYGNKDISDKLGRDYRVLQNRIGFITDNGINIIKVKKDLIYKETNKTSHIYEIPNKNLIIDDEHKFSVYMNNVLLDNYIVHKETKKLSLYTQLKVPLKLIAEYYIDGIEYIINNCNSNSITILPVIDEKNKVIGRHTELI